MNGLRQQLGFYLAILVAFLNVTGISARESVLDFSNATPTQEAIEAPGYHKYWASEEIFQPSPVPQYAESQFSGIGIPVNYTWTYSGDASTEGKEFLPFRDLKTHISELIFPFHFFW